MDGSGSLLEELEEIARASVDPVAVRLAFERLTDEGRLPASLASRATLELISSVAGASRSLGRVLVADPLGVETLAHGSVDKCIEALGNAADPPELARRKRLAFLMIAAQDLSGQLQLEQVGAELSRLADAVFEQACVLAGADDLAIIAMGKHGAEELNYSSDVDVLFVARDTADMSRATAAARRVLDAARACYRVDTALRPEGRSGALVRSMASFLAYWETWARPWEFQALLKARASAGDREVGLLFAAQAEVAVWSRQLDADDIAELRAMKKASEELVARRGLTDRELKRGRGGIRDIEFAVQLLQLVHGGADPQLRVRPTLPALAELASAGYLDALDASRLSLAYRFLRTVEHRLQLQEEEQVHTVPPPGPAREHLSKVLGFGGSTARLDHFDTVLSRYQSSVRSIHDRLFFRPLLEVFAGQTGQRFSEVAASDRLRAFGFRDAERTRQALAELTRGLTRSSRLMQQLLPVLLDWLSETPDPDQGLLGLRNLASLPHHRDVLVARFRDSPELARRLCVVLGTGATLGDLARRQPALALGLGDDAELAPPSAEALLEQALSAADGDPENASRALRRIVVSETLRTAAADLLDPEHPRGDPEATGKRLSALGDAALTAALGWVAPRLPFAIIAMGRYGGQELAYGSDLDILFVYDGAGPADAAEAERIATSVMRVMNGPTPSERIWTADASLRPEGRKGPLARSLAAFAEYDERWISAWERQSLLRARPVGGKDGVADRFMTRVAATLWDKPFEEADLREIRRLKARMERERIPAGEDPQFHLKLGRGSLADIEWTVQLLQLTHRVRSKRTADAISLLTAAGVLTGSEEEICSAALGFLTETRNRWHLVGNYLAGAGGIVPKVGSDALPQSAEGLRRLARSLGEQPSEVRERYRRVTRRARRLTERRFYGL
jgi:glutamate-ammonia-ligase adenylyltransferase